MSETIPLPDLLYPRDHATVDTALLEELLETTFLGADPGDRIEAALADARPPRSTWDGRFFADELFLDELIEGCFPIAIDGERFPVHRRFLHRVLAAPPADAETVRFRQEVLAELARDAGLRRSAERLYRLLVALHRLFRAPGIVARLDHAAFRLEILRQVKLVVDAMAADFAGAASGLARLSTVGREIQRSEPYATLAALLDHEGHLSEVRLRVRVAADGRIRELTVDEIADHTANPFFRGAAKRWWDALRLLWHGYDVHRREVVNRLVVRVYLEVAPALRTVLQVLGHLEFYLCALGFAALARERGLRTSLAALADDDALDLTELFNPLLLRHGGRPIPCAISTAGPDPAIVLVTGPNSGGKTRMLQAVGLAQVLGQSGFFVPAAAARLPIREGLFVSIVERTTSDQAEGRLGVELLRIRELFESLRPRSLVLLDELCTGTNPSEATGLLEMVLELLPRARPIAFVTTHFLDFTEGLRRGRGGRGLSFLSVVVDGDRASTYQFAEGVATTSLAVATARRLGVTREELAALLRFQLTPHPPPAPAAAAARGGAGARSRSAGSPPAGCSPRPRPDRR
jgi:DNA mismatch repair protein MutS2